MEAGKLRKRVTIQSRDTSQDDYGQQVTTWTDFATVWASVEPMNGRELLAADAVRSELSHTITTRFIHGVTPAMRVNYGGRLLNIQAVIDENERHRTLTLMCSEGLNDG